jgi:hypothetical protein
MIHTLITMIREFINTGCYRGRGEKAWRAKEAYAKGGERALMKGKWSRLDFVMNGTLLFCWTNSST